MANDWLTERNKKHFSSFFFSSSSVERVMESKGDNTTNKMLGNWNGWMEISTTITPIKMVFNG